ncbi:MAG: hypothetical protein LC648_02440 [Novosphingobium sp.]|nr:hypothetical protein [Novosphingobium sp.]
MASHPALLSWPADPRDEYGLALWTAPAIEAATSGHASADFEVGGIAFDGREVHEGDLFVALEGEQADGHAYLDQASSRTRFGVFEMGMNHPGELAELTRLVRPHVAIVTTIAPAHIGFFKDEAAIADAKSEIFEGLVPGGTAILPADSPHFTRLRAKASRHAAHVVSFGRSPHAQVRLLDTIRSHNGGTLVTADLGDRRICFTVGMPGEHWVANALAVIAAARAVGADLGATGLALAEMEGLAGRGARHAVPAKGGDGSGKALLIDESYNANPASMAVTIDELGKTEARRRIAVLGAMKELGDQEARYHAELAGPLSEARIDRAVLVGEEMRGLTEALGKSAGDALGKRIDVAHVANAAEALALLEGEGLHGGDAVLVKGSNSVGLGAVVRALTAKE